LKIVYHCYGGTHSSVLAAAVHTRRLVPDRVPSPDELLALPLYDKQDGKDYGRIAAYGRDEAGNEIFVLGRRSYVQAPEMVFCGLRSAFKVAEPVKLVDTATTLNWQMKVGGYLSRGLGLKAIGRLIVTWGSHLAYPRVVSLVETIRKEVMSN
jgi:hypothetical protein